LTYAPAQHLPSFPYYAGVAYTRWFRRAAHFPLLPLLPLPGLPVAVSRLARRTKHHAVSGFAFGLPARFTAAKRLVAWIRCLRVRTCLAGRFRGIPAPTRAFGFAWLLTRFLADGVLVGSVGFLVLVTFVMLFMRCHAFAFAAAYFGPDMPLPIARTPFGAATTRTLCLIVLQTFYTTNHMPLHLRYVSFCGRLSLDVLDTTM